MDKRVTTSIQRKLMAAILGTSVAALIFVALGVSFFSILFGWHTLTRDMVNLARITGQNCEASLVFNVPQDAQNMLTTLGGTPAIIRAIIVDAVGHPFASYINPHLPALSVALPSAPASVQWRDGTLWVSSSIDHNGHRLGTIYLQNDLSQIKAAIVRNISVLSIATLVALFSAYFLAVRLRTRIAMPILRLTDTAHTISERRDYTVRAVAGGTDEIGVLTRVFNEMLDNIAEREAALRESEQYLATTLNSIGDAVIATDKEGHIRRMNRVAQELTGWPLAEAQGQPLRDVLHLLHRDTREPVPNPVERVLQDGATCGFADHTLLMARNGTEIEIADSAAPIQTAPGAPIHGVVLVFRDVTRQRKMEDQLRQAQKMDSIGQLAGGVAHDFNNMLNGIVGATELLELITPQDNLEAKGHMETILKTSSRAAELIRNLLAFSRKAKVLSAPFDAHHCISDALMLLERTIDRRIKVVRQLGGIATTLVGDSAQIQSIILNLGLNARDAMPEGGTLTVSTRNVTLDNDYCKNNLFALKPGPYLEINVTDTGEGMSPETQKKLFEPFFTTKVVGKGTGLGLAAIYGSVTEHHGSIKVYSELGHGSVFRILLPVSLSTSETAVMPPPAETIPAGTGLILVVDDEEVIRTNADALLRSLGYDVILAEDGRAGLEAYRKNMDRINLTILDMVMPEMNGEDCFRAIRTLDPTARVLISSGFTRNAAMDALVHQGLLGFIQKPYRRIELAQAVARALKVLSPHPTT